MTQTITLRGENLEVEYIYYPEEQGGLEHEGYREYIEIMDVIYKGISVMELLPEDDFVKIEELVLKERKPMRKRFL